MKHTKSVIGVSIMAAVILAATVCAQQGGDKPAYLDTRKPIAVRVEDLLSRMTLEEKVGQMNIPCTYKQRFSGGLHSEDTSIHRIMTPEERTGQMDGCRRFAEGTWAEEIGPGGGFFTLSDRLIYEGTLKQAEFLNELQKIATEKTRLKIPVLQIEEGTHGLMCSGATIFPEGLAIGSTWNMDLVRDVYATEAREGRAIGVHMLCTLVIEPNRDPRMGRNEEGYSECPFLCSCIAESIVRGAQGDDVSAGDKLAAALCHYPGQSQPVSGLERGAMHISDRMLKEVFLPPWAEGITRCSALGVMATYPAIDGVPVHSSEKILTKILRGELGFDGVVLSEGRGISTIIDEHVAATQKEAGQIAVNSGVDVGISLEDAYLAELVESVREGSVSMAVIDRAVRRILTLKFRLGLFENPYVDTARAGKIVHSAEHRNLALQVAREGIVLLKNDHNLLPLKKTIKSIAIIGPDADAPIDQLGDYSPYNVITDIVTVLEGIKDKVSPGTTVEYIKGCDIIGTGTNEIAKARKIARKADVAIVVLGEGKDTDGENRDAGDLDLTGLQEELVEAVCGTGTPTVVVLINGRPLSVRWVAEHAPAVVEAWMCGEQGGAAVADVLFGDYNPSGRLPITIPWHVGQLPVYYNYSHTKAARLKDGYVNMRVEPLYEFGYGLSYTEFKYGNLRIMPEKIGVGGEVKVSLDVTNTGSREGHEVVQLYLRDVISSVSSPVKELRGFEKIPLEPGETKTVTFTLKPEHFSLLDRNLNRVVEPGEFEVLIGHSSKDIRLSGSFHVHN
ncbi:glycoside hydrolase family 3 C-terminal domain-containing protein [bacterium]|nr:glycoside hydrolase family 3 C-terminal domain-containing protein [bacterium]